MKKCLICGKEFEIIRKGQPPLCSDECKETYYIQIDRKNNPRREEREVTNTTKMLICVYTAEGMSIKDIALFLNRPEVVVADILEECKRNGKYRAYVDNISLNTALNHIINNNLSQNYLTIKVSAH